MSKKKDTPAKENFKKEEKPAEPAAEVAEVK